MQLGIPDLARTAYIAQSWEEEIIIIIIIVRWKRV
jgi:hypothetical protein